MDLPKDKLKKEYIHELNQLSADLKSAVENNDFDSEAEQIQARLDELAARYQHNNEIGTSRYKLYEIQALLFYYQKQDAKAAAFINQAINTRGESYPKAKHILSELQVEGEHDNTEDLEEKQNRPDLVGINGWLILFLLGLVVSAAINLYGSITGFADSSYYSPELLESYPYITALINFENLSQLAIGLLGIFVFVKIVKRHKTAARYAIIYLLTLLGYNLVDMSLSYAMFEDNQEALDAIFADGEYFRSIIYSLIWTPYFFLSKRVKATLTR